MRSGEQPRSWCYASGGGCASKPVHCRTGRDGYFRNRGSRRESSQSQKAEPRPLSTLRAWRQSEHSPTEGWNTGGASRGTSAFDEDVHGTPAADDALPVAAHGVAINLIDLG